MPPAHVLSTTSPRALEVPRGKARLYELLAGFKSGTLVVREGKHLLTRPVTVLRVDNGAGVLVVLTKDERSQAIDRQRDVQLVCQSPNVHLTVSGEAKVMSPSDSSGVTLINLEPATGEYWEQMRYAHATLWRSM